MPTIRGVLVAAALVLTGCGIPIRVERIDDPAAPVQGVRYTLHRPSYEVFVVATKTGYAVVLEQSLSEVAWTYEATTRANAFASTEISFTMEKDGALSEFSAGETDQLGPILEAAAQAALKAAAVAATSPCAPLNARLMAYASEQEARKAHLARLQELLKKEAASLDGAPKPSNQRLLTMARLREAIATVRAEITAARLALKPSEFRVVIDGADAHPNPAPCLTIELQSAV